MHKDWNVKFTPSFTPEEMLRMGVFEGKYINGMDGIPGSWKKIPKVLGPNDEPDPSINYYGVKSRQPLSKWKENGWIKTDKEGWFGWYCRYYLGRRLGEEDDWQIGRWNSFVARHMGQIKAGCDLKDKSCHAAQRQGLLQWAWDNATLYSDQQRDSNLAKFTSEKRVKLESVNTPIPLWTKW